ncbi:RNA-directed DNA polymerase, eukaryota [Tanacetum coccineum]
MRCDISLIGSCRLQLPTGASLFNSFIRSSGLVEVNLGGSSFTWCHKSATKMSKLDRFLVSESFMNNRPNINVITLERYLSDHRPILLRESKVDYGPTPFRFFHYWLEMEGFCKVVENGWKESPCDNFNAMRNLMGKLKHLKKLLLSRQFSVKWWKQVNDHQAEKEAVIKYYKSLIQETPKEIPSTSNTKTKSVSKLSKSNSELAKKILDCDDDEEFARIMNYIRRSPTPSEDLFKDSQDPYDSIDLL